MQKAVDFIAKHWVGVFIGAIATALALFGTLWPVFTRDTLPEVLAKRGVVIESARLSLGFLAICLSIGLVTFGIGLSRLANRSVVLPQPRRLGVAVFTHDASTGNAELPITVRELFRKNHWDVSLGQTGVPRHSQGIWIHGGRPDERAAATWALKSLGLSAQIDDTQDGASLQVIVGSVPVAKPEAKDIKAAPQPGAPVRLEPPPPLPSADAKPKPLPVPASELRFALKRKSNGDLRAWLWNEVDDEKRGYSIWITRAEYFSPELEQGTGGYVKWRDLPPFALRELNQSKVLVYDQPIWFELIRLQELVLVASTINQVPRLRLTRHRFAMELRWSDFVSQFTVEIDVRNVDGKNVVDVLSPAHSDSTIQATNA